MAKFSYLPMYSARSAHDQVTTILRPSEIGFLLYDTSIPNKNCSKIPE